jgi:hypothetical protein
VTSSAQPAAGAAEPSASSGAAGFAPADSGYQPGTGYQPRIPAQYQPSGAYPPPPQHPPPAQYQPPTQYQPQTQYQPPAQYQPPTQYQPAPYPAQAQPWSYGQPTPPPLSSYPTHNRNRRRAWPTVVLMLVAVILVLGGGGATAAVVLTDAASGGMARAMSPAAPGAAATTPRDQALVDLLTRHTAAVKAKDQNAFLADIDKSDATLLGRQQTVFQNLMKLPLADFAFRLSPGDDYDGQVPADLRTRYGSSVRAPGVTITYQIADVDSGPVAVPWVPVVATVNAHWLIVGELASDKALPAGVGGQAWDGGAITVAHSARVVGVFSNTGRDNPQKLLTLAEKALDRVAVVRPGGWAGKIFVIAVRDKKVFDAYFGDNPERVKQVAAIAVPHYSEVHDWVNSPKYAATRILFNPDELSEDQGQLGDDLTHEFTHAAMAPVTSGWTPTWLVEGFAEYVSYNKQQISAELLKKALKDAKTVDLEPGDEFYDDPLNYLTGWLACRMISEKFGQAKLIELYEGFQTTGNEDNVIDKILGIPRTELIRQWQAYVAKQQR